MHSPLLLFVGQCVFLWGYQSMPQESCQCVSEVIFGNLFPSASCGSAPINTSLWDSILFQTPSVLKHTNQTPRNFIKIFQLILTNFIQSDNSKHWNLCNSCQCTHELILLPLDPLLFTPLQSISEQVYYHTFKTSGKSSQFLIIWWGSIYCCGEFNPLLPSVAMTHLISQNKMRSQNDHGELYGLHNCPDQLEHYGAQAWLSIEAEVYTYFFSEWEWALWHVNLILVTFC